MQDRRHNNIALFLFIVSAVALLVLSIYTSLMMDSVSTYLKDDINERLLAVSKLAATQITAEELEQLTTPEDIDTPLFRSVRERLIAFGEENEVIFVYYMRKTDDGLYQFIVDNDQTEDAVSLATEPIDPEPSPDLAYSGTAATSGLENYSIGYEGLFSAYAPIYDSHGIVVAIAGVDISDEQVLAVSRHTRNLILLLILSVAFVVVSGLTNIFLQLRKERHLKANLEQQELMSNISQSLISTAPMAGLIKDALRRTGEFLKVSRCFIIVVDAQTGKPQPAYTWHAAPNDVANREMNSGVWPRFYPHSNSSSAATAEEMQGEKDGTAPAHPSPASEEIGELLLDIFPAVAPEPGADDGDNGASDSERNTPICKRQPTLQPVYCSDINSGKEGLCETFKKAGFKAFIMTPLYLDGVLWGVLVIESGVDKREWSTNDAQLVSTVSSAIVGVVARDLIEKERKAAFDQAVLASRAKGDFLSNMSHEMRTPMNAIIGMSTIGLAATEIKRKDYCLEKVNDASTHLLGIINDVLDMSKIEANKLELSYVSFNFAKMVERVVNVISFRVNERQQSFRVSIDEAIPRNIITDDQRLAQVLTNLLSNATKFTPEGGSIGLDVRLHEQKADALTLQIEVSDTGIGISSEQQARLFTSFEQADRGTARKFGGTGLGLAISKRIIELMDGKIWIDSELGKGATFTFTVKVRLGKEEGYSYLPTSVNWDNIHMLAVDDCLDELFAGNAARLAEIDAQQLPDFSAYRMLLAEDIEVNREIVIALLEPTGIAIDCAENGVETLRMFSEDPSRYNFIFMDVQMPEMDGCEVTRRIRAMDEPHAKVVPIVAMTANVFREDVENCLSSGMDDHVGKPLDFDEVVSMLRKWLPSTARPSSPKVA